MLKKFNFSVIGLCFASLLTITNAFADSSSIAGAGANAGASASSGTGIGVGGGGVGYATGGSAGASAGVNQLNALSNQAGSMGNNTNLTFQGTNFPADTTSTVTNRTTIDGTQTIKNVAPVMLPGLASANGNCRDSHSGGFSIAGFTLGGGTTSKDEDCSRRYEAATMASLGRIKTAVEIMCADPANRAAALRAGEPCAIDAGKVFVVPTKEAKEAKTSRSVKSTPVAQTDSSEEGKSWFTATNKMNNDVPGTPITSIKTSDGGYVSSTM